MHLTHLCGSRDPVGDVEFSGKNHAKGHLAIFAIKWRASSKHFEDEHSQRPPVDSFPMTLNTKNSNRHSDCHICSSSNHKTAIDIVIITFAVVEAKKAAIDVVTVTLAVVVTTKQK